jgi:hypothetical protein
MRQLGNPLMLCHCVTFYDCLVNILLIHITQNNNGVKKTSKNTRLFVNKGNKHDFLELKISKIFSAS